MLVVGAARGSVARALTPVRDLDGHTGGTRGKDEPGRTLFSLHDDGVARSWDLKRYDAHIAGNEDCQRRALAAGAKH